MKKVTIQKPAYEVGSRLIFIGSSSAYLAMITAAAPSQIPLAEAAVTTPPSILGRPSKERMDTGMK